MATSTARAAILIAAVVVGVILLSKAFQGNASDITRPRATHETSASPKPSSPKATKPTPQGSPKVQGVTVLVLNGTSTPGLAGEYTSTLESAGYTTLVPDNGAATATTTVFYQTGQQVNAEYLRTTHFPDGVLKPAPADFHTDADIVVLLGADAATPAPSTSPSA